MKLNIILHRKVRRVIQLKKIKQNDIDMGSPIILPGLVDDYAQRLATEAKQAADARAATEKINLHPDLLGKKTVNKSGHTSDRNNFLKRHLQRLTDICELCKFYIKLYNIFYLQRVYL